MSEWECGCGWVNGCNLATCAFCSRSPREGQGQHLRDMGRLLTLLCLPMRTLLAALRDWCAEYGPWDSGNPDHCAAAGDITAAALYNAAVVACRAGLMPHEKEDPPRPTGDSEGSQDIR